MDKDQFLVAVKLQQGIDLKPGQEYWFGVEVGHINIIIFHDQGILYLKNGPYPNFLIYGLAMKYISEIQEIK